MPAPFSNMTALEIARIKDSTARSEAIAAYGEDKFIKETGAQIYADSEPHRGRTWRIPVDDSGDKASHYMVFLRVINSTPEPDGNRKVYWLRIPPHLAGHPDYAVAWTFGFAKHGYMPCQET